MRSLWLTAQNYNVQVPAMLTKVAARPEEADEAIIDHLRTATGQISRWPSDAELLRFLTSQGVYGVVSQKRLVMALGAVEESLHTSKVDLLGLPGDLSIEHIMPQRWQTHWPLDPGLRTIPRPRSPQPTGSPAWEPHAHELPAERGPLERRLAAKEGRAQPHTRLLLNVELLERYADRFDEAAIDERTEWLAQAICRIWPGPESPVWSSAPGSGVGWSVGGPSEPGPSAEPLEMAQVRLSPPQPASPPVAPSTFRPPRVIGSLRGRIPVSRGPQGVTHPLRGSGEKCRADRSCAHEEGRLPQEIGRHLRFTSGRSRSFSGSGVEIYPHTGLAATPEDVAAGVKGSSRRPAHRRRHPH